MKSLFAFLFVTLIVGSDCIAKRAKWDYLAFAQIWPSTFCKFQKCRYPRNYTEWNIHGLWPSVFHGKDPEFCNSSLPFNLNRLQPIYTNLQYHWMNLKNFMKPKSFWLHEWDAHGRCAVSDFPLEREVDYFNATLALKEAIGLRRRLDKFGIQPGGDTVIKVSHLMDALRSIYRVNGQITCAHFSKGDYYLYEIRLCLNPELTLIDCPMKETSNLAVLRGFSDALLYKSPSRNSHFGDIPVVQCTTDEVLYLDTND